MKVAVAEKKNGIAGVTREVEEYIEIHREIKRLGSELEDAKPRMRLVVQEYGQRKETAGETYTYTTDIGVVEVQCKKKEVVNEGGLTKFLEKKGLLDACTVVIPERRELDLKAVQRLVAQGHISTKELAKYVSEQEMTPSVSVK